MQVTETFAFIDLGSGDRGLADCIAGLNNTKWKGKVVRGNILNWSRQEKYLNSILLDGIGNQCPLCSDETAAS